MLLWPTRSTVRRSAFWLEIESGEAYECPELGEPEICLISHQLEGRLPPSPRPGIFPVPGDHCL